MVEELGETLRRVAAGVVAAMAVQSETLRLLRAKGLLTDAEVDKLLRDAVMGIPESARAYAENMIAGIRENLAR